MYLRGEPDYLHEEWLHKSVPAHMESVMFAHLIKDREDGSSSFFNLLHNFNLGISLSAIFLGAFFTILLLSFFIGQFAHRIRFGVSKKIQASKWISSALSNFKVKHLCAVGVFVLFIHLFLWLNQLFLTNNIKTNKVVRSISLRSSKPNSLNTCIILTHRSWTPRNWSRTSATSSVPTEWFALRETISYKT